MKDIDGEDGQVEEDGSEESDSDEDPTTHIELKDVPSLDLFELLLRWLYSASVEIP